MTRRSTLAKLTPPRMEGIVSRPRLARLLDRARRRRLIWVVGPPGSGKTTMVASWLRSRRLRHLWLQLDEGDSDVASFFHFLAAAARQGGGDDGLPMFTPESRAAPEGFARQFVRALGSTRRAPSIVVLDDFQHLSHGSLVHRALAAGLGELPEGITVVVVSRGEPPPVFARLATSGGLELIGGDALAFNAREARALAARRRRPARERESVAALVTRTEGWAAGLALVLGGGRPARRGASLSPTDPVLADLFDQEVLAPLDEEARRLLVECAILPRVDGVTAARLTGIGRAEEILAGLARRSCFVSRQGDAYQLHALFHEFLSRRAAEVLSEGRRRELARGAALLLERANRPEDAFLLHARAADWEGAARLVLRHAAAMLLQGRGETLVGWGSALSAGGFQADPWLQLYLGQARAQLDPRAGVEALTGVYGRLVEGEDANGACLAWAAIAEIYVFQLRELGPLDHWIQELERLRGRFPVIGDAGVEARLVGAAFAALAHRQPWHPALPAWEQSALEVALSPGDEDLRMCIAATLSLYYGGWVIDLGKARLISGALTAISRSGRASAGAVIAWRLGDAIRAVHDHEPEAGREAARAGLALAASSGLHFWDGYLHQAMVLASLVDGDRDAAEKAFEELTRSTFGGSSLAASMYHHTAALMCRWRGDEALAREHARTCRRLVDVAGAPHMRVMYGMTCALAAPPEAVKGELESLLDDARRCGSRVVEGASQMGLALLALRGSDEESASRWLRGGLGAARSLGCRHFGWFSRAEMAELCALALDRGIEPEYVRELIRVQRLAPAERALEVEGWPWALRIRALGEFLVTADGKPLRMGRKAQKRPLEMLQMLVAAGPLGMSMARLGEALWPDAEGDAAQHALGTTVYRLRKLLGVSEAVVQRGGRVALDPAQVFVDAWAVVRLLDRVDALRQLPGGAREAGRLLERVRALYRGDLFGAEAEAPVMGEARERLRRRVMRYRS